MNSSIPLRAARFGVLTIVALAAGAPGPQQGGVSLPLGDVFSGTGNPPVYSDQFSGGCENTSPYQGMNPLVCHGVMAPTDSRGQCSLRGMRLLRKAGNTCYYCQPIRPPIKGIIIPLDQISQARAQGFGCGVDEANPNCMAVCWRVSGNITYYPPSDGRLPQPRQPVVPRNRYGLPRPRPQSADPCLPFGPGYDYCANPAGTQPAGCDCSKRWPAQPNTPAKQNAAATCTDFTRGYDAPGADPAIRYQVGFNQGFARCLEKQCTATNVVFAIAAVESAEVRMGFAVMSAGNAMNAVMNPPGFEKDPDPYIRGKRQGLRLCNWMLQLPIAARGPIIPPNGEVRIPRGFDFYDAAGTLKKWVPEINPGKFSNNCGPCTLNYIRVMLGQPIEPAPNLNGMSVGQIEAAIGTDFTSTYIDPEQLYQNLMGQPEGTVGAIAGSSPNGGIGHVFGWMKVNSQIKFIDPQKPTGEISLADLPGYRYIWLAAGNGLGR